MADVAEPASWQLVEFVAERVRLIRRENGYRTDIGLGLVILDDSDVPEEHDGAGTIIEVSDVPSSGRGSALLNSDATVIIVVSVPRGAGAAERNPKLMVHRARRDLIKALTFHDNLLPQCVRNFEITDATLGSASDDDGFLAIAQVTARAGLTEITLPANNHP